MNIIHILVIPIMISQHVSSGCVRGYVLPQTNRNDLAWLIRILHCGTLLEISPDHGVMSWWIRTDDLQLWISTFTRYRPFLSPIHVKKSKTVLWK